MIGEENHFLLLNGIQGIILELSSTVQLFLFLFPRKLLEPVLVEEKNKMLGSLMTLGKFLRYNIFLVFLWQQPIYQQMIFLVN